MQVEIKNRGNGLTSRVTEMYQLKMLIWVIIIFVEVFVHSLFANDAIEELNRPRIGLALSGGGAKGFAHIGIIKMLDSLHIPIDYIAGTSMGGIAGGLYAIGYRGIDLERLANRSDWEEIFTDVPPRVMLPFFQKKDQGRYQLEFYFKGLKPVPPSGLIFGQKVLLLFTSLTYPFQKVDDFDRLPIPFRCIAVDLVTGNEVVINKGPLPKALRSTMAIPTVFSPVEWGDSLLVDGGLINNLPIDVVRDMGADVIIAVDVESPLRERSELNTGIDVLNQTIGLLGLEKKRRNLKIADIVIRPDVRGFTPADFDREKIKELIRRGDQAAQDALEDLIALKHKHHLFFLKDSSDDFFKKDSIRVYDVQVMGNRNVSFKYIFDRLKLSIGGFFQLDSLRQGIADLRATGYFEGIDYEVVPYSDNFVRVLIRLKEIQNPQINRIEIFGNINLPFSFIYRLIGLKPGDLLSIEALNEQIMEIYGLGYFEFLEYYIEAVGENLVNLHVVVKELPIRRLRVGLRYDDLHKLVAVVSGQATNLLIPGIRWENEFQFAGLNRFTGRISYPSRALNLPVYPFMYIGYKDISTNIFDGDGSKIATYKDRSSEFGVGLGFLISKAFNAELQYQQEYMNIKPEVALPDPDLFASWKDELHRLRIKMDLDLIDDVLLPRNGFRLCADGEINLKRLKSEVHYSRIETSLELFRTYHQKNTIRFYGFYGEGSKDLPVYKFVRRSRPEFFVGMEYDQVIASKMVIVRFDYRYEYKKDVFFKLIANTAFNIEHRTYQGVFHFHNLYGAGVGVKLLSPVGPLELIISRGSKSVVGERTYQNLVYFSLGYRF